jgi:hypothetical protein
MANSSIWSAEWLGLNVTLAPAMENATDPWRNRNSSVYYGLTSMGWPMLSVPLLATNGLIVSDFAIMRRELP